MAGPIWELDFYSRPVLDENQKKLWEVLICESPQDVQRSFDSLFKYTQFCQNTQVNSLFLQEAIQAAIAQAPESPKQIRFFRRQMNNMIEKACTDLGIKATPSLRTYALQQWLQQRQATVYPQQEGYDPKAAQSPAVQYPVQDPAPLPDAVRGDKDDKWAFVTLEVAQLHQMNDWDIAFGEGFSPAMVGLSDQARVPGVLIFSPRAMPLAGWMSGLEIAALQFLGGSLPRLVLQTGFGDNWILADIKDETTRAEAEGFEQAKKRAQRVHFFAIQQSPESESFAGFWLLQA
ncbi:MAG: hypothetical protein BRC58_04895 [Cyanobacteria bacterium QS_8_64_29]|nr:MAG: hypothetical protein BRC58_04895 [Cyanobacteria bacterium QS_8_64_29]